LIKEAGKDLKIFYNLNNMETIMSKNSIYKKISTLKAKLSKI